MTNHNPYQAPATNISSQEAVGPAGGTLESGIAGDYNFEITEVLTEAWQKTSEAKGTMWGAYLLIFLAVAVISFTLSIILGLLGASKESQIVAMVSEWLVTILMYPFLVGAMMLGIRHSVNLPINSTMAFNYLGYTLPLVGVAIMMMIFTIIGFFLLIIPGIYLSMAYLFAMPLIVEKQLGPWQALESSRQAVTHHWFKVFLVSLAMWFIIFISMIPIGIGLIWTLPMWVNLNGILYRIIFGVEEARQQAKPPLVKIF
jgi:hypothetical protein